ncbi:hypothetical protein AGMMS49592_4170 [Endomicrobiia bacterium]|nr:hypothetical protein AGMMS49592_4170 [Endomicrobiia bacterium]
MLKRKENPDGIIEHIEHVDNRPRQTYEKKSLNKADFRLKANSINYNLVLPFDNQKSKKLSCVLP